MVSTRITHLAANNQVLTYLLQTQKRMHETQVQVASEKVSQDYTGIADDSSRLISLENKRDMIEKYVRNNEMMDLRLNTATTVINAIEDTVKEFDTALGTFSQEDDYSEEAVEDIQELAFNSLKLVQGYLNTEVDGRYLFSGGRANTSPVDLGLSTLTAFQTKYDGSGTVYPPTRTSHLAAEISLTSSDYGQVSFNDLDPDTITATTAGAFANIPIGATFTVAGSDSNDGTYTVVNKPDNQTLVVSGNVVHGGTATVAVTRELTTENNDTDSTITLTSWYDGDDIDLTHRVDENSDFTYDLKASDPAFEKAIRAMGIILQGDFGTAGGLDSNQSRVSEALYLLDSALDATTEGVAPYSSESVTGNFNQNIEEILMGLGFDQTLIDNTNTVHNSLKAFYEGSIADIENIDTLEAITRLLDDEQALSAAYQATARIRDLSLSDFMR